MSFAGYTPCESISKRIFYPCQGLCIKMKVGLGSRDQNHRRKRFIGEYQYDANGKYNNINKLSAFYSETKDYLIVEESVRNLDQIPPNWKPLQMFFSYDNLHQLEWMLNDAYQWLLNPKDICDFDKVGMLSNIKRTHINLMSSCLSNHGTGYACGIMKLSPTIRTNDDDSRELAVLVTMGADSKQVTSMTLQEIASFLYFLQHFDLCSASIDLTNQVLVATPFLRGQNRPN